MKMETLLKPITLDETSFNVSPLHKALKVLGLPVVKREVSQNRAGQDTLKKVRILNKQLNVSVAEPALVDEASVLAISGILNQRGLTEVRHSFTVAGTVRLRNGTVKKRQCVLAFDLDLRGVSVYRDVKNFADIRRNGGFEFLGEAVSDSQGNYSITFYNWQYRQAERDKADVVVYAAEEQKIIGLSRIVDSEDYSDKRLVRNLDVVIIEDDKETEYELLMSKLKAFLQESKTSLTEIAASGDQLAFTARELDIPLQYIYIAAAAKLLSNQDEKKLLHELFYGIGRQDIILSWAVLSKKQDVELRRAITVSAKEGIIRSFATREVTAFLKAVHEYSIKQVLDDQGVVGGNTVNAMLACALPEKKQRLSFLNALTSFTGSDFREFWSKHLPAQPEFRDKPELISALQLNQQLSMLTGNHQALVEELHVNRKITSVHQLMELENDEWQAIFENTGVPDFIAGVDDKEKVNNYTELIQGLLNAVFPTQRIAKMVEKNQLNIEKTRVSKAIVAFLKKNVNFDFANSRIHNFKKEIKDVAGNNYDEVKDGLMKIQRVFQVSTRPEVMTVLMENNLGSSYTISSIPRKVFIKKYANALGGESAAMAVHQRASHINTRAEMNAMHLIEYSHALTPRYAMASSEYATAMTIINRNLPNPTPSYVQLFGSPDICECKHCRSVHSAAAYFVDLLRFLQHGETNSNGKTPLEILTLRRPDLLYLPLTCENTKTEIPYVDLVNEVMECYAAVGSLGNFKGYDTGEATSKELRASPQNFDLNAYLKLKDAKYPFTLPYHQPLDVIRTYSDHLKVTRYEVMKAMNPSPDDNTRKAIEAESLGISQEEYLILTGEAFDTTPDTALLHEYYGYDNATDFKGMQDETDADGNPRGIRVLLERTGLAYTDLVELVKTTFINPYHMTIGYLEKVFSYASIDASTVYAKLKQIKAGTLDPAGDADIIAALNGYNSDNATSLTPAQFKDWVIEHLEEFQQVITLYEPGSKCALETTKLKIMQNIHEGAQTSGISNPTWSKVHRFIRLWKKLGWTIHETDLILTALGQNEITVATIAALESIFLLQSATKRPLNELAVLWGNIDTYGNKSLYKKLFLNRTGKQIDKAFKANAFDEYLQDETETLLKHRPAIIAAFGITEEDLDSILKLVTVIDGNTARNLGTADKLNIQNLSVIYRYVVLAKALKMGISDMCKLISLFNASPFSTWDIGQGKYTDISPVDTYKFYKLGDSTKEAGFKPSVLEYILQGTLPADSKLGLEKEKILKTAKAICDALAVIERDHPEKPEPPMTSEALTAKLSLTFQPDVVSQFIRIIEGIASFDTTTDKNLNITIPDKLSGRYTYIKSSGRLNCAGIMSVSERSDLTNLNANNNFKKAIKKLYEKPEIFISSNFSGIFIDFDEVKKVLLNRPEQTEAAELEEKLAFVYKHFIPRLKKKLRRDIVARHIASLIGLSEASTALLIAGAVDKLISHLSVKGFSASYFSDAGWTNSALDRIDSTIDFSWENNPPAETVPADNFSVRWKSYIATPASGQYTLIVEVEEVDEEFRLYLDDVLVVAKISGDATTSWEKCVDLNAAKLHMLILEYAETSQKAGVRLYWKTSTKAPEIIPSSVAYPAAGLDKFVERAIIFHRAAKFIEGFKISETELDHFITYPADFGDLNFEAFSTEHWERIRDYIKLRNGVPQARALLTDVFTLANTLEPTPTIEQLTEMLHLATAWDRTNLEYLVTNYFNLVIADFKNEIAINRLYAVMKIVIKTSVSAETVKEWGAAGTDFYSLHNTGQLIKSAVKTKYEEADWLEIAAGLSDKIRENQKQALISYLLTQSDIQNWGAKDADSLFEYLLIDVQMGTCMDTSRIVQANAAIQMFINRCLLNMESKRENGSETGVSPEAIDKDRWEWMKNYRVWEANRKVFLYPENWLEPEWRRNRSQFFRELESYLVQNDITERSVEQAFRNYLASLNEVANLDVCGMYQENDSKDILQCLHVFGRTHNAPYKYYYRTWNKYRKWSAWEKVPVDIRTVENGDNSGVHLIPVVWKERLFLFWPEFIEAQKESSQLDKTNDMEEIGTNQSMASLEASKYWEIRLAWSEYVDGKWSPKQLSKEFIELYQFTDKKEVDYNFCVFIDSSTKELSFSIRCPYRCSGCSRLGKGWKLVDIQSKINAVESTFFSDKDMATLDYCNHFMKFSKSSPLSLNGNTYLGKSIAHKLLYSPQVADFESSLNYPFFYSDDLRTYFVRPVNISPVRYLREPALHMPYIPRWTYDGKYRLPSNMPPMGPDPHLSAGAVNPGLPPAAPIMDNLVMGSSQPFSHPSSTPRTTMPMWSGSAMMRSASVVAGNPGITESSSKIYSTTHTGMALGTVINEAIEVLDHVLKSEFAKGLEFHTFYHPFSSTYVSNLNLGGISRGNLPVEFPRGLMESDTEISSDDGDTFKNAYDPEPGRVQEPSDFDIRTYYKENICFDVYGANSIYNWELFFHAPLYIATRLSKNGKYREAMKWFHYIFDPTTDEIPATGEKEVSRYWKVLPFKATPIERLEDWFLKLNRETDPSSQDYNPSSELSDEVSEWRDDPFNPHLVASNRPLAYMKYVIVKYVDNLIAWADSLFRQFTRENVNEALQLYVIANHILGPRPEFIPKRGEIKAESYENLKNKWDAFSNALVELENLFPYSSDVNVSLSSTGPNLLGMGPALYFCIPTNEELLDLWNTVADRLDKIRHCKDIDGVERRLALFAPPISPAALIQAVSQGLSLGSILADLSSPPPIYRFTYLIQKANEFCADVKALGSALLAALEKKDAEELSRLRASHETDMLELMTAIKERQVLDAKVNKESLLKTRDIAKFRLQHYIELLGNELPTIPPSPTISATLTSDSQLPADTAVSVIKTDVDESLVDSGESGVKLIPKEQEEFVKLGDAHDSQKSANIAEMIASIWHALPDFVTQTQPLGCGFSMKWGTSHLGYAISAVAKGFQIDASNKTYDATIADKYSRYIRREQDWTLQANLAAREIIQLDKQITLADIRIQVADKELENHKKQLDNAKEVELFLKDKFSNQELYQWMKEQFFAVYKQSYNLSYDMAKKAEKAYKYEMGTELASFVQYGYWDNSRQGLVSGEKLQLALRQMEKSYLEENRRELELTKSVSLAMLDPLALIELRETGKCYVTIPEELFDLDFQGHYFRRIKSVSLSIPCIAGPYTGVNCTLRLLKNTIRINTKLNSENKYVHENEEGLWTDDNRFRSNNVLVTSMAASKGQNDAGIFEFNFRDERYLPFEGAGVISDWMIELGGADFKDTDDNAFLRQFDYSTISDVIIHLNYTARESSGTFKDKAIAYMKEFITNYAELSDQPLMRMFSIRHEFPSEWHKFLHPADANANKVLSFTLGEERFPFFAQDRNVVVMKIDVFARCTQDGGYHMKLSYPKSTDEDFTSTQIDMDESEKYGGLNKASIDTTDYGLDLEELDITKKMTMEFKHNAVEDIYLVLHYKLSF
jgi:hypothetical protein